MLITIAFHVFTITPNVHANLLRTPRLPASISFISLVALLPSGNTEACLTAKIASLMAPPHPKYHYLRPVTGPSRDEQAGA
jgi:hypothetical protein